VKKQERGGENMPIYEYVVEVVVIMNLILTKQTVL
jgi:hypothetical protein